MPVKEKYLLELKSPDLLLRRFTMAFSKAQAWSFFKRRAISEGWDYLLNLDNVNILISKVEPEPAGAPMFGLKPKKQVEEPWDLSFCPKCKNELEDDYCQKCGWQRFSAWYGGIKQESKVIEGQKSVLKE